MRILLVDVTRDFGLFTPLDKPMGGLQSGVCYLARELSLQGHDITIANATETVRVEEGVRFVPWNSPWDGGAEMDAIIITAATGEMLNYWQAIYGRQPQWILWVHYDVDQAAIGLLANPADRDSFDGFLFVSEWQAQVFREKFGVGWDRSFVMRNAVSPPFRSLFEQDEPILPHKSADPLFVYTSTPYRGLGPLMNAVPMIRERVPNARFQIFSSWAVYGRMEGDDPHLELYNRCKTTPGVEYVGSVPQTELAQYLKSAWCLAYPNVFQETSCIAVMEGLASGCKVVTTHRAALPETTGGFGALVINPADEDDLTRRFADLAVRVVGDIQANPEITERELQASVAHARKNLSWGLRATQLAEWLSGRKRIYAQALANMAPPPATAPSLAASQVVAVGKLHLVQGRHGALLVDGLDGAIGRSLLQQGEWLDAAAVMLQSAVRAGDVVVEVGAHIGALTLPMAKAVGESGKLYAFEAREHYARQLAGNLSLNGLSQVELRQALVGTGDDSRWAAATGVAGDPAWQPYRRQDQSPTAVLSVSLDQALPDLAACRLVKISAPGMVADVLFGMSRILAQHRPLILCEITSDSEFTALRDLLADAAYSLHWQCNALFNPNNSFQAGPGEGADMAVLTVLAIPLGVGVFSPLHPALFAEDPDILFPGQHFAFRQRALTVSPRPAADCDLTAVAALTEDGLAQKWQGDLILTSHLTYLLAQGHGESSKAVHGLWREVLGAIPGQAGIRALALGGNSQGATSLWGVIAKSLRRPLSVDCALSSGHLPQEAAEKISLLFWIFALDRATLRFVDGTALQTAESDYHLVYARSAEDCALAARLVAPGGLLVVEGAGDVPLVPIVTMGAWRVFRKG